MGTLRLEIWDPPGIATFERRIAGIAGVASITGTEYRRQVGRGSIILPADYPRLSEIINVDPANTANMAASTVRVYRNADLLKEFLVTETPNVISDSPTNVRLDAIEAVMDWAVVEPWDWDGTADFVSSFPDWIWGGRNVLVDPAFADPQCNPRISEFWTDATSGNWTVNVNGAGPVNVAFNIGALALEAAYQTMVADVLVEGSGANTDPWRVTFVDPCFPNTYVVTSGTLNGVGIVQTLIDDGDIVPVGWTESKTLSTGVPITFGDYTTFEVDTPPAPAPSGTNTALHVVGTNNSVFHFPGAQTTPSVTPGGLYQAGVWVYPVGVNQDFRLVLRPLDEEPLIDSSTWPSVTLTANTWTLVPIVDAMIPEGIDRIIFRIAAIENSANFWVTDAYLEEGQAPTTVGDIVGELLADAQTDHAPGRETITFIDPTFDATLDTAGVAWAHSEVRISIPRGMTYRKMLEALLGPLGYEWSVTPSVTPGTWELNIWNPGGRVVDVTAAATPSLLTGQGTLAGYATRQLPRGNRVVAEGEGGYSSRAEDTASQPVIGVREAYRYDPAYMADMVDEWADEILARFVDESYAPRFDIADPPVGSTQPVPMIDYGIATRLNVDLADGSGKVARDVEAVSWRDSDQGLVWTVHTGMAQFDQPTFSSAWANQAQTRSNDQVIPGVPMAPPETTPRRPVFGSPPVGGYTGLMGPVAEGTRWLLDAYNRQRPILTASALPLLGGGGDPTFMIAASDAFDIEKEKADYICDGTDDDYEIMQAMSQAATNQGLRIVLSSGTFFVRPDMVQLAEDIHLHGMGRLATKIRQMAGSAAGATVTLNDAGSDAEISHLTITAEGGALGSECLDASTSAQLTVSFCWFQAAATAVAFQGRDLVLSHCRSFSTSNFLSVATGSREIRVFNNYIRGFVHMGNAVSWQFENNIIDASLTGSDARGVTIVGNQWVLESVFTDAAIELDQDNTGDAMQPGVTIAGNTLDCEFEHVVHAENVVALNIVGNTSNNGSYLLESCPLAVVANNQVDDANPDADAIHVTGDECLVTGNQISWELAGANTVDGIGVSGDNNYVTGNKIKPSPWTGFETRYGINIVSGDCNVAVGNSLGDPGAYSGDAINDSGTNTQLNYPNDPAYGDNFTGCGS